MVDSNLWFRFLSVKERQRSSVAVVMERIWDWRNESRFWLIKMYFWIVRRWVRWNIAVSVSDLIIEFRIFLVREFC